MMSRLSQHPSSRAARGMLAAALLAAVGAASSAQVAFRATTDDTFKPMSRNEIGASVAALHGAKSYVVVSFERPLLDAEKTASASRGMTLLSYLGGNNWIAAVDANAGANAIAATPALVNLRELEPQWKLETTLAQGNPPEWTILDAHTDADEIEIPRVADEKLGDHLVAVYINFHADVSLSRTGRAILDDLKIESRSFIDSTNMVVAHARLSQIRELVQRDEVMWVEPAEPAWTDLNNSNRLRTQVDQLEVAPYGLTGAGVNVMVYDGGTIRASHEFFRGDSGQRVTIGDTDGVSDHATHVAGTVAGRGQANGNHKGMAPDAHILSYGFEVPGGLQDGFLYTDPGDLNADYSEAINTFGAHLSNNSIGSNTAPNGFPCVWEGNYGNTAALIDTIARGSLGRKMIIVWAAGNERQGTGRCNGPNGYFTSAPPGNAKNQISVGALNSNDDSITSFTSFGPDDAGRMRPDVSGPGCQNGADPTGPNDSGVTSASSSSDTALDDKCGTSMSSPTVAGIVALMLQDWRLQFSGEPDPLPSTVKALLAHNAADVAQPGPDNRTGYGSVRAKDTIDHMRSGNFAEAEVTQGGQYSVLVFVAPGDPEFKVTIAWDDAPAVPFASPTLVNDLDLVVIDPNGNRQYPWTLNATSPWENAVRTQPNTLDNIEQVFVENPTPGVWQVNVVGTNVPVGPQTVSLAASPLLVNCSSMGIASLDRSVYQCGAELALRVSDCDLNMDDNVAETVIVHVTSDSDPMGEMVVLTETGPLTADFRATLQTATTDSVGVLRTLDGDTVTLTYVDADNGSGGTNVSVIDTATVDCAPPIISGVAVNPGAFSATVEFMTDEDASVVVDFGETCANLDRVATGARNTDHAVTLSGLTDGTQYAFTVTATDDAGNVAVADNMGSCFTFATTDIPTYFVQQFTTSLGLNDLNNIRLGFTPEPGNIDFYSGCAETIAGFDFDPTGGTTLPLLTSNSVRVDLADGATVSLYGQSYSGFWVNAAGNITFNSPDSDTIETFADHFAQPRISPFFDGMNSGAGTVSWKQTSQGVAVTWENVADNFSPAGPMTFQVVMYFDGTIELNYLTNNGRDGLVGLSPGGGTPVGFEAIDLSSMNDCGPRPPLAGSASFQTAANTNIDINLPGSDDGLPAPSMLTYMIESLPANGRLYDSTNTQITTAPTIIPAPMVTYRPNFNYLGTDSFTYSLNDGGVPPEGGPSNIATIDLTVGGPTPIFTENFNTDPGWSTEGQWAFGQPTGQGSRGRDPVAGFTGQFVYGYNLNGDYSNNMPAFHLTTPPFDLSGLTGVSVSFYRWLGVERSAYDKARFEVSTDGTNWTVLFENSATASLDETAWTQHTYDVSAIADNQPSVRFRWVMGTTDVSVIYHGWNIDDFSISALVPLPNCTGDTNGDGLVNFSDLNTVLAAFGQAGQGLPGDVNQDDVVNFTDLNIVLANFGVDCNK